MIQVDLQQQSFRQVNMVMNLQENRQMEVENTFALQVDYAEDNKACMAVLRQAVRDKEKPEEFAVELVLAGLFACEGIETDEDKKQAHVKYYEALFPYAQSMIAAMTVSAGLPAFMAPRARLDPEKIQIS